MVSIILIALLALGVSTAKAVGTLDHPITIGMVLWPLLAIVGLVVVGGACLGLIWLFNPFRSGH